MIADRWGVTADEVARHYPCDDFAAPDCAQVWRGLTVLSPAQEVWPWVAQIRVAPYSFDWIDNRGRRSPQQLLNLAEPVIGEHFTTAGDRRLGRILSVEPGVQLTASIMGGLMSYVLVPADGSTRLLLKVILPPGRLTAPALSVGDLVMARKQLLNLKRLAERHRGSGSN